ncbi:MAG: nucleotide exchange factor GrpE [Elusimicrobia bacterium]|nr:nucleotide exchange factor GrpE [Elusimicrobiota bacterium]
MASESSVAAASRGPSEPDPAPGSLRNTPTPAAEEAARDVKLAEEELLKQSLEEKEKQLAELKDKYLRSAAELENARRRWERERVELAFFVKSGILFSLIPVWEEIRRGAREMALMPALDEKVKQGFLMTMKNFEKFLGEQGLEKVSSAVGAKLDPFVHEVVRRIEGGHADEGTIVAVEQDGYALAGKILRPARVIVAGKKV